MCGRPQETQYPESEGGVRWGDPEAGICRVELPAPRREASGLPGQDPRGRHLKLARLRQARNPTGNEPKLVPHGRLAPHVGGFDPEAIPGDPNGRCRCEPEAVSVGWAARPRPGLLGYDLRDWTLPMPRVAAAHPRGHIKLIRYVKGEYLLCNLTKDIGETTNLIAEPERRELVGALKRKIRDYDTGFSKFSEDLDHYFHPTVRHDQRGTERLDSVVRAGLPN